MPKIYFNKDKCLGCFSCSYACAVEHSKTKDPIMVHSEEETPIPRRAVRPVGEASLSVSCNHCETPLCVEACISGAMRKLEDCSVICDTAKCTGCWMCIMVCPFSAIKASKKYAVKCDLCPDRKGSYACIESCKTKALYSVSTTAKTP
ncbi:MAG: 4Fe-4S ferredoxin [Ruminiclostridium sp.]|nr:4Fe-4S ferredoxin [Ruminiclostridium sp.]